MAQGAHALFRMVMAGLLLLVLFGASFSAHAHGAHAHGAHAHGADGHHGPIAAESGAPGSTGEAAAGDASQPRAPEAADRRIGAAPDSPPDDDGCGRHGADASGMGCCTGGTCPMMQGGVPPVGLIPAPPPERASRLLASGALPMGIGTPPAFRPPRASA